MSSSGTDVHTFAKRDGGLQPPIIAGIVIAVVGFNLIIALSWCIFKDRKKLNKSKLLKRHISAPIDCEKYESSAAFAISTRAVPPTAMLKAKDDAPDVRPGGISYYELIRSLQQPAPKPDAQSHPSPTRLSHGSSRGSADSAKLKQLILRPEDLKDFRGVPYYPKTKQRRAARQSAIIGIPSNGDLKRPSSFSADTASVYSSASAPLEQHESLSRNQPFALEPIPTSAPAWITDMPKPPMPAIITDTTAMECEVPLPSPTSSTSESSEATVTIEWHGRRATRSSPGAPSPISLPNATTPCFVHARTNSTPSVPPRIQWLTKSTTEDVATDTAPRSKRPNSVSSLSTIFSLREHGRSPTLPTVIIAPLKAPHDSKWGSVDMARGGTPLVSPTVPVAQRSAPPMVPKRSPKRPPPSASAEHLPR